MIGFDLSEVIHRDSLISESYRPQLSKVTLSIVVISTWEV